MLYRLFIMISTLGGLFSTAAFAEGSSITVTMTNDPLRNQILVYDSATHQLLQTLPTQGKGGATGNARGIRQVDDRFLAAVNYGSNTIALFERTCTGLQFVTTIKTSSPPVSVAFGHDHLYVAGNTTADSFAIENGAFSQDGSINLVLVGGGAPPVGSTAQIGVLEDKVLVTLKTDPTPGTVDMITLGESGELKGAAAPVAGPVNSLTPFGFSTLPDGSAFITLAHSGQVGIFRDGNFSKVVTSGGQAGPCWTTHVGKYIFIANAGSSTVSREISTGSNIFVDSAVAGTITLGSPNDLDAKNQVLVVIDHSSTTSHLNFFSYNEFGELSPQGSPVDLKVPAANGVAIMSSSDSE